jgi:hypothetical protein
MALMHRRWSLARGGLWCLKLSFCQQNSESAGDSRENPSILKSDDSKIQHCRLGHNFMVIFVRICPTLEVVRIFNGKYCILVTENLEKFGTFFKIGD